MQVGINEFAFMSNICICFEIFWTNFFFSVILTCSINHSKCHFDNINAWIQLFRKNDLKIHICGYLILSIQIYIVNVVFNFKKKMTKQITN